MALKWKLGSIGLIVLLGFAAVILVDFWGAATTAGILTRQRQAADAKYLTEQVKYQILDARRLEKEFLIRRDPVLVEAHQDVSFAALRELDTLRTVRQSNAKMADRGSITEKFNDYRAVFADVVANWRTLGLDENSGLRGSLRDAAHRAERLFSARRNENLTNLLLMMRRHEKDFFIRVRKEYVQKFERASARLQEAIDRSTLDTEDKRLANKTIGLYAARFHRAATARNAIDTDADLLNQKFAEIEGYLNQFVAANEFAYSVAVENVEKRRHNTLAHATALTLIVASAVLVLLYLIGRQIRVPIQAMSKSMISLARGNIDLEIPGIGRGDEIGGMAASIQVFRENKILADHLAAEREELNIAERKHAAKALAESEARYRSLVELSPEGIVVHHRGTIIYANSIAAKWFGGESAGELVGRSVLGIVHPDDAARIEKGLAKNKENLGRSTKYEVRLIDKKGQPLDVSVSSGPITFDGKEARQLVIHDITARKRMEAQLAHSAKLATIGELSAGILHELTQPLNIARMATQRTLRIAERTGNAVGPLREQISTIDGQMTRMSDVIDHMRVFSRKDHPPAERFDVRDAVRAAVNLVRESFASEGLECDVHICDEPAFVRGHVIGLEQVVLNLLTNARDAVRQRAETEKTPIGRRNISAAVKVTGIQVVVTVEDDGGGIPTELLGHIFEPFYTTKAAGRGTGLGLSICHSIVSGMSGWLTVENSADGAKFYVALPLASDHQAGAAAQV